MYIAAIMRQEQDFGKAGALSIMTLAFVMVVATIFTSLVFKQEKGE
jgi:ABC-type sugar transport system permease subunit